MSAAAFHKELRALLPAFLATIATVGLATQTSPYFRVRLLLLAVCVGSIALGALSVGHEYIGRTLTLLLALPVSRARLFATKGAVLLPLVLAVPAAAYFGLPGDRQGQVFVDSAGELRAVLLLAPLCAICLAPPLSMLCRSALAGIVFTLALAGLFLLAGEVIGTAIHGFRNAPAVEAFKLALVWRSLLVMCAAGVLGTWVTFKRLQAIEGHSEVVLPAWLRRASTGTVPARRVPNVWAALVQKELHLQQLTFVVAALYLLACGALWALRFSAPEFPRIPTDAVDKLYCALLGVLIGAVASAEERQLGTLSTQLLQPVSAAQQWAIKTGTVLGLALLLGIGLPLLVNVLAADPESGVRLAMRSAKPLMMLLLILTSASLYVSTVCSSGVRAVVTAIPLITGAAVYAMFLSNTLIRAVVRWFPYDARTLPRDEVFAAFRRISTVTEAGLVAAGLLFGGVVLWLAAANHRRIDHSRGAIAWQAAIILAVITLAMAFPALVQLTFRPRA